MPKSLSNKPEPLSHDPLEVGLALYFAREEESDGPISCLSEQTIREFLAKELDNRHRQHAISHLAECSRCSAHLARLVESPGHAIAAKLQKFGVSVQETRRKASKLLQRSSDEPRNWAARGPSGQPERLNGENKGFEWSLKEEAPGKSRLTISANDKWLRAHKISGSGALVAMVAKWDGGREKVRMMLIALRISGKVAKGETMVSAGASMQMNSEGELAFILPPTEAPSEIAPTIKESRLANFAADPAASGLWDAYLEGLPPETLRAVRKLGL